MVLRIANSCLRSISIDGVAPGLHKEVTRGATELQKRRLRNTKDFRTAKQKTNEHAIFETVWLLSFQPPEKPSTSLDRARGEHMPSAGWKRISKHVKIWRLDQSLGYKSGLVSRLLVSYLVQLLKYTNDCFLRLRDCWL